MSGLAYQGGSLRIERPTGIVRPAVTPGQKAFLYPNVGKHFALFTNNKLTYRPTVQLEPGSLPDRSFGRPKRKKYVIQRETVKDVQNFEFLRQNRVAESSAQDPAVGPEPRDLFFRGGRRPDAGASAAYFGRLGRDIGAQELRPGYNRRRAQAEIDRREHQGLAPRPAPPPTIFGIPAREIEVPNEAPIVIGEALNDVEQQTGENAFGGPSDALPFPDGDVDMSTAVPVPIGQGTDTPAPARSSLRERPTRGSGMRLPIRKKGGQVIIRRVGPSALPFAASIDNAGQAEIAVPMYAEASGEGVTDPTTENAFAGGSGAGGGAEVNVETERGEAQNPDVAQVFAQDPMAGMGQGFAMLPDPSPAAVQIDVVESVVPLGHTDMPERIVQLAAMASDGNIVGVMPSAEAVRPLDGSTYDIHAGIAAMQGSHVVDVAEGHIVVETQDGQTVTAHTGESCMGVTTSDTRPEVVDDVIDAASEMDVTMKQLMELAERNEPLKRSEPIGGPDPSTRAAFKAAATDLARRITGRANSEFGANLTQAQIDFNLKHFGESLARLRESNAELFQQLGRRDADEERQRLRAIHAQNKAQNEAQEEKEKAKKKRRGKKKIQPGDDAAGPRKRNRDDDDDNAGARPPKIPVENLESETSAADAMREFAELIKSKFPTVEPVQIGGVNGPFVFKPSKEFADDVSDNLCNGMIGILGCAAEGKNASVNRIAAGENEIVVGPSGRPIAMIPQSDKAAAFGNNEPGPVTLPATKSIARRAIESGLLDDLRQRLIDSRPASTLGRIAERKATRAHTTSYKEVTEKLFRDRVMDARRSKIAGVRNISSNRRALGDPIEFAAETA